MATILGQTSLGHLVKLNENGIPVEFYVAAHNYIYCPGRTLLVRKEAYDTRIMTSSSNQFSDYEHSEMDSWLENVYKLLLDKDIQDAISGARVRIKYGGPNYSTTRFLYRSCFLLALSDLIDYEGDIVNSPLLHIADILKVATLDGEPVSQWTRSGVNDSSYNFWVVNENGERQTSSRNSSHAARPCVALPSTFIVGDDGVMTKPNSLMLENAPVGTVVKLNEYGKLKNYAVVHKGKPSDIYDESCDGIWVLKDEIDSGDRGVWSANKSSSLGQADITKFMSAYEDRFDDFIKNAIKTVKVPYIKGSLSYTGENGFECRVFALGAAEVGQVFSDERTDGSVLDYFSDSEVSPYKRTAFYANNGSSRASRIDYHLRSVTTGPNSYYVQNDDDARILFGITDADHSYRTAMILSKNLVILPDGTLTDSPIFDSLPIQIMEGQFLPITWSAMDGATAYTLQRKVDSGEWETIYTGSDATYMDTIPSGSGLQYQVAATIDSALGVYGISNLISIIPASTLAVSGEDSNLGTIMNDILYTVNTDTGNRVHIDTYFNKVLVNSRDVSDATNMKISIFDLPIGEGEIKISASVQDDAGPVSMTRTWQYTKTPINFPNSGAIATAMENGQVRFPITLAEAVRVPGYLGGSLDKALSQFAPLLTSGAKIETGSYVGTGQAGSDKLNTLNFSFPPRFLIISHYDGNKAYPLIGIMTPVAGITFNIDTAALDAYFIAVIAEDNQLSWFSSNPFAQFNTTGVTYHYTAIG